MFTTASETHWHHLCLQDDRQNSVAGLTHSVDKEWICTIPIPPHQPKKVESDKYDCATPFKYSVDSTRSWCPCNCF